MKYDSTIDYRNDLAISIGSPTIDCHYCSALKSKYKSKGICCSNGRIKQDAIVAPSDPLKSLVDGNQPKHTEFLRNILQYNKAFQMTSFKRQWMVEHGFMPTFKVQGHVYRLTSSILLYRPDDHTFAQIYFISNSM